MRYFPQKVNPEKDLKYLTSCKYSSKTTGCHLLLLFSLIYYVLDTLKYIMNIASLTLIFSNWGHWKVYILKCAYFPIGYTLTLTRIHTMPQGAITTNFQG
jgi:hypothetical protein